MIRKTLTILSLIGLLISVALWGVSYFCVSYGGRNGLVRFNDGAILCHNVRVLPAGRALRMWGSAGTDGLATQWQPYYITFSNGKWQANLPFWIPTAAFVVLLPIVRLPGRCRRKRKKLGLCLNCGYDLRASKDICPECGEEFGSTNP